ncbi:hypothetical protein [Paenibacillus sanguinis]|uniref:hypothetical protein n=1 Tax=Paenibacillus sanguinis TaxID=225906 RepID=UPI000382308B|nr:hypothetical protein [Paenibacillus sanguinis]
MRSTAVAMRAAEARTIRVLFAVCCICVFVLLAGCRQSTVTYSENLPEDQGGPISIKLLDSSDEEYSIVRAAGADAQMIFTLDPGEENMSHIKLWVDRYVNGEKQESVMGISTSLTFDLEDSDELLPKIYWTTYPSWEGNPENWTLAVRQQGGVSTGKSVIQGLDYDSTLTQPVAQLSLNPDDTGTLGVLARNKDRSSVESNVDVEKMIQDHQEAYVLRCLVSADEE